MGELSGDWTLDTRLVRAFRPSPDGDGLDPGAWPATVPAAAELLREGLELGAGVTILVGENGSGKSTVVEMLAEAYGDWGIRPVRWADLQIVQSWREFLDDPELYLRYLLAGGNVGDL